MRDTSGACERVSVNTDLPVPASILVHLTSGDGQELGSEILGRLGCDYDAEVGARVTEAGRLLQGVSANVAMLLHDRGVPAHVLAGPGARRRLRPQ